MTGWKKERRYDQPMLQQELFVREMHLWPEMRLRRHLRVHGHCASLNMPADGRPLSGAISHGSGHPTPGNFHARRRYRGVFALTKPDGCDATPSRFRKLGPI
jgi:hypothetical protein